MDPRIAHGLALLRARDWFEAHEVLEGPWREAEGEPRTFLQAIIQGSVALEHLRRGNARGAYGQWQKARAKAAVVEPERHGVALRDWMRALDGFFADIALEERARKQASGEDPRAIGGLPAEEDWPLP